MTHVKDLTEFDIFLPAFFNDGTPIPPDVLEEFKHRLFEEFGGITDFRHHSAGAWNMGGVAFWDDIVIVRVLSASKSRGRAFLKKLKMEIAERLHQEEVLIVERTVKVL